MNSSGARRKLKGTDMQTKIPLHDYQLTAKDFLLSHPRAGLFLDVGFGKTATTIAALYEMAAKKMISGHILIIAPKPIARATWIDEFAKWGIKAKIVSLIVDEKGRQLSRESRLERYNNIETHKPSIYLINRENICDLIEWHITNRKKWPFPTIVIDELQSFKGYNTKRFKAMKSVMPFVKRFIGLTGTPVPNGLMDLWSEIYFMDGGERLGKTISAYRDTYFNPGYMKNGYPVTWIPKFRAQDTIFKKISDLVISVKNPNIKLPSVTYNNVFCYMDDAEQAVYDEMLRKHFITVENDNGEEIEISAIRDEEVNPAIQAMKLSQLASGAIYTDEEGDEKKYIVIHRHKLEQLQYIIDNTGDNILIAYHFKSDLELISEFLKKEGYKFKKFDGSPDMIHLWNEKKIPIMLIQPASAGHGINIQHGGHTLVWYTMPWSLEHYIQTNGRLNRQGQEHPVVIHHLITYDTIDERIVEAIKRKDLSERTLMNAVSAATKHKIRRKKDDNK